MDISILTWKSNVIWTHFKPPCLVNRKRLQGKSKQTQNGVGLNAEFEINTLQKCSRYFVSRFFLVKFRYITQAVLELSVFLPWLSNGRITDVTGSLGLNKESQHKINHFVCMKEGFGFVLMITQLNAAFNMYTLLVAIY